MRRLTGNLRPAALLLLAVALVSCRLILDQHHLDHLLTDAGAECELCALATSPPGEPPVPLVVSVHGARALPLPGYQPGVDHPIPYPRPPSRGPPPVS